MTTQPIPGLETVAWLRICTTTSTISKTPSKPWVCGSWNGPAQPVDIHADNLHWIPAVRQSDAESALRAVQEERDAALAECERLRAALRRTTGALIGAASAYRTYAARIDDMDRAIERARAALDACTSQGTPTP